MTPAWPCSSAFWQARAPRPKSGWRVERSRRGTKAPATALRLPREAWREDEAPRQVEGAIRRTAYSGDANLTTLQLLEPSRTALEAEGYEVIFSCADASCGGFDFRFHWTCCPRPKCMSIWGTTGIF